RVDADIDRLVGIGERADPAPDRHDTIVTQGDRVDPAADAAQGFTLVHGHVGLAKGPRDHAPVQQVTGAYPQPPPRNEVEREPGGVFVELTDLRVDACRVQVRAGQFTHRGDDADVGRAGDVAAAEHPGQLADVPGADIPGPGFPRHDERQILRLDPFGKQA